MTQDPESVSAMQARVRDIAVIKAVLAAVVLLIMLLTFRHTIPLIVSVLDLLAVPVYVWAARRWPVTATYVAIAETALALTPRQFVQGYVNGINWLLYLPLPLAAAYVIGSHQALVRATILVTSISAPIMLIAALMLPAHIERVEILTLVAYVLVVLWGITWLSSRVIQEKSR